MTKTRWNLWHLKFSLLYVAIIPIINWAFANTRFYVLPDGGTWSPFSILVGLVLVVRDFSQREIGHYVFIPLLIGVAFSYYLAAPEIATASACAFLVSELCDWLVFTFTKYRLSTRVLISSAVGVPIDSIIFLVGANMAVPGLFSAWTLGTMIASKLVGIAIVFYLLRKQGK